MTLCGHCLGVPWGLASGCHLGDAVRVWVLSSGRVPWGRPQTWGYPRHPLTEPQKPSSGSQEGLTADDILHHLVPVLHPDLAPLARGVQVAGQDDHRRQAAQRLLGAASREPQQLMGFSGGQAAQDGLAKDVTCQVGRVVLGTA